jgi:outer membrane protein TolC
MNAARTALLQVQTDRLVQRVNLHLALGGSFEPRLPSATSDAGSIDVTSTSQGQHE